MSPPQAATGWRSTARTPSRTLSRVWTTPTEVDLRMTPDQEQDFIERQVNLDISRRHFMQWAGKAGLAGAAVTALGGGFLAACSSKKKATSGAGVSTGGT